MKNEDGRIKSESCIFALESEDEAAPRQNQTSLFLHSACTIFALESEDGRRLGRTKQVCFCARLAPSLPQIRMKDVR